MTTIELRLEDAQAKKLAPYHDKLPELLELGLQAWLEQEGRDETSQAHLLQLLVASGKVSMPTPHTGEQPHTRQTPVPIDGKPVSEILVEQRQR